MLPLSRSQRGLFLWAMPLLAVASVACLLWLDEPVAQAVRRSGADAWLKAKGAGGGRTLSDLVKLPGEWWTALVLVVVALVRPPKNGGRWSAAVIATASVLSAANTVIKWTVGRTRPFAVEGSGWHDFHRFRGGLAGLINQSNLTFPSGHTSHAFAVASAIWIVWPRWGWLAFVPATVTAAERVLSNSHYLSDVCMAGSLGIAVALLARAIVCKLRTNIRLPS
jgi:membrane-associated phospholipid phosphatase